jgi:protein-tyrosine phosphatase
MAERLAVLFAERLQVPNFTASSAGTRALVGHPIHQESVRVIEKLGGDASNSGARRLTTKIASGADLILTMTREHCDIALETAPRQLRRTFTLAQAARLVTEFAPANVADLGTLRPHLAADERWDIGDPIGQSPEFFAEIGAQIAGLLPPILELCQRSAAPRSE